MVLTFCGMVNIAARIRSTSGFTSWNCYSDLCRVISFQHDSSGTISIEGRLSLRFWKHCPPTRDLKCKHPSCFVRGSRLRKSEFQAISQNRWPPKKIVLRLKKKNTLKDNIIEHFSCLKRNIRAQYVLNYMCSMHVTWKSNPSSTVIIVKISSLPRYWHC